MVLTQPLPQQPRRGPLFFAGALVALLTIPAAAADRRQGRMDVLRIGTSGTLSSESAAMEKASLESLRAFIKDETGLNNEILRQKN